MLIVALFVYSCSSFIVNRDLKLRSLGFRMGSKSLSVGIHKTLSDYLPEVRPNRVEGFVKFLLEDFHVHEIDLDGKILHLEKHVPLDQIKEALVKKKKMETGQLFLSSYTESTDLNHPSETFRELDKLRLTNLLTRLSEIMSSDSENPSQFPFALLLCTDHEDKKQVRTRVHRWIRADLPFLESKTIGYGTFNEDKVLRNYVLEHPDLSALQSGENLILLTTTKLCRDFLSGKLKNSECDLEYECLNGPKIEEILKKIDLTDYSTFNPKSFSKFLHFNLLKINRETSEVVNMMCKWANRGSFDFFSAGNKDKRGITVQKMCVRRCKILDLLEAMSRGRFSDVYVGDFCYKNSKIGLGDLSGNHFKIAIRGIEDASKVERSIENLKNHGFINYFGLQRFGTKMVGTHVVGAAILDQRYELALRLILGDVESAKHYNVFKRYYESVDSLKFENPEENQENLGSEEPPQKYRRACDYYLQDKDTKTTLKYLPKHLFVEKSLLKGVASNLPFDKCLERVPKNILTIYVHSTQSLLFNLAATERLNRFGLRVAVGDLVATGGQDLSGSEEDEGYEEVSRKRVEVKEIGSEDEASRYTIEQVVLPLPGDNVEYPSNMKDYYEKVALENFGIPLEGFTSFKNVNEKKSMCIVSVRGSYRYIVVKPKDVSFEVVEKLDDPFQILIKPEIEGYEVNLEGRENTKNLEKMNKMASLIRNRSALILKCSLPKSSYITVALREILTDESIENNKG